MTNELEANDKADKGQGSITGAIEITLDFEGPVDWTKAIQELESGGKEPAAPAAEPTPTPEEEEKRRKVAEGRKRYEELCKKPSMTMKQDDLRVYDELSEILSAVNTAMNLLKKFEGKYAYLIAPNVYRHLEENLKDASSIMMREFHNLRNGKQRKTYDKRCVCTKCKMVYMVPLPDGICDECRANSVPKGGGAY